jgi:hypothetical protein
MGEMNAYNILIGKPEGKIPLGRHRRRWEDNIRMDVRETGWEFGDRFMWIRTELVADCSEHDNKLSGSTKGGKFLEKMIDF